MPLGLDLTGFSAHFLGPSTLPAENTWPCVVSPPKRGPRRPPIVEMDEQSHPQWAPEPVFRGRHRRQLWPRTYINLSPAAALPPAVDGERPVLSSSEVAARRPAIGEGSASSFVVTKTTAKSCFGCHASSHRCGAGRGKITSRRRCHCKQQDNALPAPSPSIFTAAETASRCSFLLS